MNDTGERSHSLDKFIDEGGVVTVAKELFILQEVLELVIIKLIKGRSLHYRQINGIISQILLKLNINLVELSKITPAKGMSYSKEAKTLQLNTLHIESIIGFGEAGG